MKEQIWKKIGQTALALGFLLLAWGVAYLAAGNELLVPAFSDCFSEFGKLLVSAAFWRAFLSSLLRAILAFALSFLFALFFAVVAYLVPSLEGIIAPVMSAIRSLPVLAVLLILLLLLDAGRAPVAVAFLSLFPMLYAGTLAAFSSIDEGLIQASRVSGASKIKRITRVYLPLSAPYILRESGAAISFSVKLVVSAEVLSNTARSLGGMMQEARIFLEISRLFALVGAAFLAGLLLELLFSLLTALAEKRIQ